jgi:hypothetical protein
VLPVIANPTAHRRTQAFADALDDGSRQATAGQQHGHSGQQHAHAADRHADPNQGRMLSLASALREVPRPKLDENRKIEQRAQLIAAMEAALADGTLCVPKQHDTEKSAGPGSSKAGVDYGSGSVSSPGSGAGSEAHRAPRGRPRRFERRSRWSRRLAVGGLSVVVAAGAFGGVAAASTDALPGDTLYSLKRGMEDMRLTLADDESDRGEVYLDLASVRLQEARRLMQRSRNGDLDDESVGKVRGALSGMQQEASEGHQLLNSAYKRDGSLQPMEALNTFSSTHREGWSQLRDRLPSQLADVSEKVTSVFDAIEQDVAPLKSQLPAAGRRGISPALGIAPGGDGIPVGKGSPTSPSGRPSGSASSGHSGPSPSSSKGADSGLIGGAGDLLGKGSSPSPSASASSETAEPSVTLPPLLPGVLPDLGIGAEDAE